jgi:hypothetical protein
MMENGTNMKIDADNKNESMDLRCPECRARLKPRRGLTPDKCEMICGGCGKRFDVCDLQTLAVLKEQSQKGNC